MKNSSGILERLYWNGYLISRILGQRKIPFCSKEKLRKIQEVRARKIIRFACRNVPYYRNLFQSEGLRPDDFNSVEDISRLPVLTPLEVRKNPDNFRPDKISLDTMKVSSSGTTGVPREILHDAVSILSNTANGERSRFFYSGIRKKGRKFREAHLIVPEGASSREIGEFIAGKTLLPSWVKSEREYFSMLEDRATLIEKLNEFKPDVIRAYGSAMNMIAEAMFDPGVKLEPPQVLVYVADAMSPRLKRMVMDELGVQVYSEYSSVECLQLGYECEEHRGYHLNEDTCAVRIVDDEYGTLPDGSTGRVIVSNLVNRANVLLNYELGDEAAIIPGQCGCGRTSRMVGLTLSRVADRLKFEDGTEINPIVFAQAVFGEDDLWQHQVVQRSENEYDVCLVANPAADRAAMKRRLEAAFERWFQKRIRFQFRFVDQIELTQGGKQRAVVFKNGN